MNGIELGFEIALGFVLFGVAATLALVFAGLLIRIPISLCGYLIEKVSVVFSPERRKRATTFVINFLTGISLVAVIFFIASIIPK
jgi:hypothetical protein